MKKWWKRKVERWAAQFLYSLTDQQFEDWVRNIALWRSVKKNLVFDQCSERVEYKFGYRAIHFPLVKSPLDKQP